MAKKTNEFKPRSLAQSFIPPDGMVGRFGWLCGYSADSAFMDDVAGRFTMQSRSQRAWSGKLSLALIADPGNEQVTLTEAPGVAHLPVMAERKPFRLLHAKVALLVFVCPDDAQQWHLRLVVSTGNWTRLTVEESLDMAWTVDLAGGDLAAPAAPQQQACADIKAAGELFSYLRKFTDESLLAAHPEGRDSSQSTEAIADFERRMKQAAKAAEGTPRFFDNRRKSLLSQLPDMVRQTGAPVRRNYIAMGSGFFEGPSSQGALPKVLCNILAALQEGEQPLLAGRRAVDVVVNPLACQAVATAFAAMQAADWRVLQPTMPGYFSAHSRRALHAKFIFSANRSTTGHACTSGWLYLGSGNLTGPGFGSAMRPSSGNLEAGVVLATGPLKWHGARGDQPYHLIGNLLGIGDDGVIAPVTKALSPGQRAPDRGIQFTAGPVSCLLWRMVDAGGHLVIPPAQAQNAPTGGLEVLDESGTPCARTEDGEFIWPGQGPRQVRVRWGERGAGECQVPVLDECGRMAGTAVQAIGLDEAWSQLDAFPMPPAEEDLPPEGDPIPPPPPPLPEAQAQGGHAAAGRYPVRQMMQLMENIAHKQTAIDQADWSTWCWRLEQALIQARGSPVLASFLKWELNPLSVLRVPSFVPDFCQTPGSPHMRAYETALRKVALAWNVDGLDQIGAAQ